MNRPGGEVPEELPCVWVLAGVLCHRICDRGYECEGCDLHRALSGTGFEEGAAVDLRRKMAGEKWAESPSEEDPREELVSTYVDRLTEGCTLHLDRAYSTAHFWVQERPGDEALLGFDCQTVRVLFPVTDFLLPRPGIWLKRGEAMGWLQRGHLILPLISPISGEVLEVNQPLVEELKLYGFPQKESRWFIRVALHEGLEDVPGLLRGEAMLHWYEGKLALLADYLRTALSAGPDGEPQVGITLNDGGEPNLNLEEVLGSVAFQELLDRLFPASR